MPIIYVPPLIIEELDNVMKEEGLTIKSEGLKKIALYSQIGRRTIAKAKDTPFIPINLNSKYNIKKMLRL